MGEKKENYKYKRCLNISNSSVVLQIRMFLSDTKQMLIEFRDANVRNLVARHDL